MNQETNLVELIYEFNAIVIAETSNVNMMQDSVMRISDFFFQKPKTNAKFLIRKARFLGYLLMVSARRSISRSNKI